VIAALAYGVLAVGLLLAGWLGISAARRRPTGETQMVVAIVLEAALVAQTVVGLVRLSAAGLAEPVTFVAYSIGILIPVPLGFQLARLERTHWGSVALGFTALVVAVMTLRLLQLWGAFGD
jgi:hypothetical protein